MIDFFLGNTWFPPKWLPYFLQGEYIGNNTFTLLGKKYYFPNTYPGQTMFMAMKDVRDAKVS